MDHDIQNGTFASPPPIPTVEVGNYAAQRLLDYRLTTESGLNVISPMERKDSATKRDDRQAAV
jgi:hypothetical protein